VLLFSLLLAQLVALAAGDGEPAPRYALFKDAAAYAGVPVKTLRDWVRRGIVPAWRIGPQLLQIDLNDIDAIRRRVPTVGDADDDPAVAQT
jgi:hypothetical protein